ncbi:DUF1934 domain-containing protein [Qiania dongpingensis]|uniref:DUF1934 domain-containing protein n=1 Tax=Qiania dongpingensis TaxID=2763669 RepID=A0A7G9G7E2_9FIRM|nr:DUF1934 domain-containing protein [Qiania dongpingensis]QNM06724.1 DUF1934 domain-containing protein [Qiania dongpingensis]
MQREVLIFLVSDQTGGAVEQDRIEVITAGQYFYKNGKHYVIYDEISEESGQTVKNIIKIYDGGTEIIKSGDSSVHMVFEEHKKDFSYYDMPYGKMFVSLETNRLDIREEEDRISVRIDYRLEIDYQHMADCLVEIRIESKENCKMNLGR